MQVTAVSTPAPSLAAIPAPPARPATKAGHGPEDTGVAGPAPATEGKPGPNSTFAKYA